MRHRNFKVLGAAVLAVLALSVVSAASSQAAVQQFHCTSTSANCFVEGTSSVEEVENSKCTAEYAMTIPKTSSTATVNPNYTGCKMLGVKAVYQMNGCDYTFTSTSETEMTTTMNVNCPAGKVIEVIASSIPCTMTIGPQNNRAHIVFTNDGGVEPTNITAKFTVTNTSATTVGAKCPNPGGILATLTDSVTMEGFEDNAGVKGTHVGLHVF